MKTLKSTLALITLAPFCAFAQPVATAANVPTTNFTAEFYFSTAENFSPGPAGANQTWDFSNLNTMTLAGTNAVIPSAGTPYANLFPTANWLYTFTGFGMTRYYYHKVTADKFDILSLGYSNLGGHNYNQDPRTFAVFPYTYNTVYNDTYKSTANNVTVSAVVTYDAYGTLIMPYGTFTNVIRQKVVADGNTNYNWFNVSPFYPILQTVLEENSLGMIKDTSVLSVTDQEMQEIFDVCPNPTSGKITIQAAEKISNALEINLFDMTGRQIISKKEDGINYNSIILDLENQQTGIYLLRITAANGGTFTRKILKQ